jgi:hypothetical protein
VLCEMVGNALKSEEHDKSSRKWGHVVLFAIIMLLALQILNLAQAIYEIKVGISNPFRYIGF